MNRLIATSSHRQSLVSTHKVLRNTYFLLSLTLTFSAIIATVSTILNLPAPGAFFTFIGVYGLLFLTHRLANSSFGIVSTFALTGFMGYTLGPLLHFILATNLGEVIAIALGGTALVFFCCSFYVIYTKQDMSFLSGIMIAGFVVLMISIIANLFLQIPSLALTISMMFILFSSSAILLETSNIIHGGETNYIRATVSLYVSIYNIFVSLLHILGSIRSSNNNS